MSSDIRIRVKRPRGCVGAPPSFLVEGGPAKRRRSVDASLTNSLAELGTTSPSGIGPRRPLPRHRFIFKRINSVDNDEEQQLEPSSRLRRRLRRIVRRRSGVTLDFEAEEPRPCPVQDDAGFAILSPVERLWTSAVAGAAKADQFLLLNLQELCRLAVATKHGQGGLRSVDLRCEVRVRDGAEVGNVALAPQTLHVTALMVAAAASHVPLVELLLSRGADPLVRDDFGKTPIDYAEDAGATQCALLLTGAALRRSREADREADGTAYVVDEYVLDPCDTRMLWDNGKVVRGQPALDVAASLVAPGLVMEVEALPQELDREQMEETKNLAQDEITLRFEHDSDWSTESNFNSADEDSNDENYYLNDYPDEEDFELDGLGGGYGDKDDDDDDDDNYDFEV